MSRRRYRVGQHPEYDKTFDRLALQSMILNPQGAGQSVLNFGTFHDMPTKTGLQRLLVEWRGDHTGNKANVPLSRRAQNQQRIAALQDSFARLNQRRVNYGKRPVETMDNKMLEELFKLEAEQDVIIAEIRRLEELLSGIVTKEKQTHGRRVLRFGCRGESFIRGGNLVIIDGQNVALDNAGIPRIKDEQSPYDGMAVVDYREKVCTAFREYKKKWKREKLEKLQVEARAKGEPIPRSVANERVVVNKADLPKWPENVEKFDWK